jgi:DNA topoisomerase-1
MKIFSTPEGEVELRKGRFGPYLKWGKENVKIPRGTEPESLTADDVLELISKHQPSAGAKGRGKSAPKSAGKTAGKAKGRAASTRAKK